MFNKETETIRQLVAKSTDASPISNILLACPPSAMLLFKDIDKKIKKAMVKSTYSKSGGSKPWGAGKARSRTSSYGKKESPYRKPQAAKSSELQSAGKAKGRSFQKGKRRDGHQRK
jgi:hypothetical protein